MRNAVSEKPAIAGGVPAKQTKWGSEPRFGKEELQQLKEALGQDTLFYALGKKVSQLERDFAEKNGIGFAVACSSGTAAIHAALIAVGISPGEEVIVTPVTDMGSLIPILYQGAVPVFADLHPHSYEMLPDAVEAAITPQTRAVLAVHLWGNACDMNALREICARHDLALIEDCAQALGCRYEGKPIGTIGHIGCFSLNEYKHITCGDGGLAITDDPNLAHRLRLATDKGYNRDADARVRDPAFLCGNYRMTELQGAAAVAQLRKLDSIVARRRRWCSALSEQLQGLTGLTPPEVTPGCEPSWWFYLMRMDPEVLGVDRPTFVQALRAEGLGVREGYLSRPVYESPIFTDHSAFARGPHPYRWRQYGRGLCATAEQILDTALLLGVNEAYTETDLGETTLGIQRVCRWYRATAP